MTIKSLFILGLLTSCFLFGTGDLYANGSYLQTPEASERIKKAFEKGGIPMMQAEKFMLALSLSEQQREKVEPIFLTTIKKSKQAMKKLKGMNGRPQAAIEDLNDYFEFNTDSPYMLLVADVKKNIQIPMNDKEKKLFGIDKLNIKRSTIPAVTHVDYSARIQTVHKETNPKYYKLIKKFKEITNCSVLVNTSFNVRGEPIVCTIEDAFKCFMGTNLDILVCENFILYKDKQIKSLLKNYKNEFHND